MATTMWFEEDILNALRAAALAAFAFSRANQQEDSEFLRGYLSALHTLSAAFGVDLPEASMAKRLEPPMLVADSAEKHNHSAAPRNRRGSNMTNNPNP